MGPYSFPRVVPGEVRPQEQGLQDEEQESLSSLAVFKPLERPDLCFASPLGVRVGWRLFKLWNTWHFSFSFVPPNNHLKPQLLFIINVLFPVRGRKTSQSSPIVLHWLLTAPCTSLVLAAFADQTACRRMSS